jgi:hypothetical protein
VLTAAVLIKVSVTWWGQSFHCYVNNLSASEAISLCWWDLRVHYHDHRNPTASSYCSKNCFIIFLPSVSRLSEWVFFLSCSSSCPLSLLSSLQGSMPLNCAVSSCYLLSVCLILHPTQNRRYVMNPNPYSCQCVICKDLSTICGCDSESYIVFSFIWIMWTEYLSFKVLAAVHCDVNKEKNHIPVEGWLLLVAIL